MVSPHSDTPHCVDPSWHYRRLGGKHPAHHPFTAARVMARRATASPARLDKLKLIAQNCLSDVG
jgi:hypothetical protein